MCFWVPSLSDTNRHIGRPKGKPFSTVLLVRALLTTRDSARLVHHTGRVSVANGATHGETVACSCFFLFLFFFSFHDAAAVICHVVGGERLRCICDFTRVLRSPSRRRRRRKRSRPPNLLAYKFRRRLSPPPPPSSHLSPSLFLLLFVRPLSAVWPAARSYRRCDCLSFVATCCHNEARFYNEAENSEDKEPRALPLYLRELICSNLRELSAISFSRRFGLTVSGSMTYIQVLKYEKSRIRRKFIISILRVNFLSNRFLFQRRSGKIWRNSIPSL